MLLCVIDGGIDLDVFHIISFIQGFYKNILAIIIFIHFRVNIGLKLNIF